MEEIVSVNVLLQTAPLEEVIKRSSFKNKHKLYKLMEKNQPKRDAKGRFVKVNLTKDEYEAKIKRLNEEIDEKDKVLVRTENELKFWKQEYKCARLAFQAASNHSEEQYRCIEWLLDRAPFWIRKRYYKWLANL